MVTFSVVIASYLGSYGGAARNREQKILRAINSIQSQTFRGFEIIVVADGCKKTIEIVSDLNIKSFFVERKGHFSGTPRNKGIEEAEGKYITYLDIDDVYGENHIQTIADNIGNYDWVWYNDIRYNPRMRVWYENKCDITVMGRHGTSNICHKKDLSVAWDFRGYAHDHYFIEQLLKFNNFTKIPTPEYYVCHIPGDQTTGYDL